MDLSKLSELGPIGIAIGAMAYISYRLISEITEARKNYTSFVNDNNHTTTELVREATATMVKVGNQIESHNELLKIMINKQK